MKRMICVLLVLGVVLLAGCKKNETVAEEKEETAEAGEASTGEIDPEEGAFEGYTSTVDENSAAIKDISEVIDMNLAAADAAKQLQLVYMKTESGIYYFFTDDQCDGNKGMLWCDDFQYKDLNNWSYSPGETDVTVYGIKKGMTREEVAAAMSDPVWKDVTDEYGVAESGDFYYLNSENMFFVNGLYYEGVVDSVTAFSGKDY